MRIAMVPRNTGSGHIMRVYAIARALKEKKKEIEVDVYLSSLQSTFVPMFEKIGVTIIDLSPKGVNHAPSSNLSENLNWETMINGFLSPTFFDSKRILLLMRWFCERLPKAVVSDFDMSAIEAADKLGIPSTLITERYNSPIVNISDESLEVAGFQVDKKEISLVRQVMDNIFTNATKTCVKIFTDKPYVKELDHGTLAEQLLRSGKMEFSGPIIRPIGQETNRHQERKKYGVSDDDFLIVATIGGTTMFRENYLNMRNNYINLFLKLKQKDERFRMILLARDTIDVPQGMICLDYLPDWISLLKSTDLLIAHPGWITVTEVSAMKVPAIFYLSSSKEYHEWESYQRLEYLGYWVHRGNDMDDLMAKILNIRLTESKEDLKKIYKKIAPHCDGAKHVAAYLAGILN